MSEGFSITCGMCGQSTDLDAATKNLPMDHFRCVHCKREFRRVHQPAQRLLSGFVMPGHIRIEVVGDSADLNWRLYDGSKLSAPPLGRTLMIHREGTTGPFLRLFQHALDIHTQMIPGDKWALTPEGR